MAVPFEPKVVFDTLGPFDAGVNTGLAPLLLPKNQMASATNATVRGTYVTQRPALRQVNLGGTGDLLTQALVNGPFQGGCYFQPDSGNEGFLFSIGGRLFRTAISENLGVVTDVTIAGDPNPGGQPQAWCWQSEEWVIVNDGISNPVFWNVNSGVSVRSNYNVAINFATTVGPFVIPAVGATVLGVPFVSIVGLVVGDLVTIKNKGTMLVQVVGAGTADLLNINALPVGQTVPALTAASWTHIGTQLPPGRMGAYVMGRNWVALVNSRQFVAGDAVGGSSGTVAFQYRDAVLNVTENNYLAGGGFFSVPGSVGDIRAIKAAATLDASLGQGPVQVFTPNTVFSVNSPTDRLTWQDITNPILTESLISNGALSQDATVSANGDLLFRSLDGLRSLILARREFATWGNTPISFEVDALLSADNPSLLAYSSAVVFNNRLLVTASPTQTARGVIHRKLVPLNFDPVSTLRGKQPSVYDSKFWSGLNTFKLFVGQFRGQERAFALTFNDFTEKVELWEILRDEDAIYDNSTQRIVWSFQSASLFREAQAQLKHQLLRLLDGEIYVDELEGQVDFQAFYKPDQYPCFVPWFSWSECKTKPVKGKSLGFRPRMGLGEPSGIPCDEENDRPLREGYTFDFAFVITGKCRFLGATFSAVTVPQTRFAKPSCSQICPPPSPIPANWAQPPPGGAVPMPPPPPRQRILENETQTPILTETGDEIIAIL